MSDALIQPIQSVLNTLPNNTPVKVGFSGGLDSTVLLHVVTQLVERQRIQALHVHHGLSPQADHWLAHCQQVTRRLGVELVCHHAQVANQGAGIEDAARRVRHRFFRQQMTPGAILFLAHHQNDQQETLLFRLVRGAGPKGLGAMAMQRQLGEGTLYRPWLGVDQAVIKHYAEQQQLSWVDDPSNAQVDFDRNFLRHTVIPSIEQRWPNARQAMARTAELCRDTETLMADLAQIDCQRLSVRQERLGVSMCRAELVALSGARQANIIRHLCIANGITVPAHSHWLQIEDQILATEVQDGNGALVRWRGGACSAYRGRIYLLPGLPEHLNQEVNWDGQSPLVIDSVCRLSLEPGGQLNWDGQPLCIRPRQPGMRSKPAGRGHSQALKKLLQEHQLEPWLRHSVPLVYQQQSLKAVADVWVETGATTDQSGAGMRLVWQPLVDR